jgi:nucleoside-diphosphate-sugar epimerase
MDRGLNFLLIGGGGFVGSWLAKNLVDKGHKVSILDPHYNYFKVDSTKFDSVKKFRTKHLLKKVTSHIGTFEDIGQDLISKNDYDVIVHLAAHAIEKPFDSEISLTQITKDIELTYQITSSIKHTKTKAKLVYMSSSAVYGDYDYATTEHAQLNPKSIYGISKSAGELLIKSTLSNWNIVRANAAYGFGDLGDRATHVLAEKAFNKEKAWVNDSVWCDFVYVKDLAEGIARVAVKAPPGEVFNISGGEPYRLLSYVEELGRYLPLDFELKSVHDRPKRGVLDNSKAKMVLDWHPEFDLVSGVKDYIKYVRKYKTA